MRKAFLLSLLAALCATVAAQPLPAVRQLTLSNGMAVWIAEDSTMTGVYGAVVVRAGAKDCPGSGIAHYFEHLMFKGTDRLGTTDYRRERPWLDSISAQYDTLAATADPTRRAAIQRHINRLSVEAARWAIPNEFNNLITAFGGTALNAYTSFDETVYHNRFTAEYLPQWCELNAERLIHPVFRLFQSELETVYEEKNMYADNLLTHSAEQVQRYALRGTPYAYPIVGETDSLKNPRLSEMRAFYDKYYVAGNMGLILCGNLRADGLRPLLERTFGRIRPGTVAAQEPSRPRDFRDDPGFRLKVPIPIVKMRANLWQGPGEDDPDHAPFSVAMAMLYNGSSGMMDSLVNDRRLLYAMAGSYAFKDFTAFGLLYVLRLIVGSKRKAGHRIAQLVERLKAGQFGDDDLEAAKLSLERAEKMGMEDIGGRSTAMVNAFSHGRRWADVAATADRIGRVTRQDVMRAARRFFNDDSLVVNKTLGSYPKEHVSQPGYRPVTPQNTGRHSAYADSLLALPRPVVKPRLVDLDHAARTVRLAPLATLYAVRNPQNDVFTLEVRLRRGTWADRRIALLAPYLDAVGTTDMSKNALSRRLRSLGATLSVTATSGYLSVKLTGFDGKMRPAVELLKQWMSHPATDNKRLRDVVGDERLARRMEFKDNSGIASAVAGLLQTGDSAETRARLTMGELRRIKADELVRLFADVRRSQTDVLYCGRLSADSVAAMVRDGVAPAPTVAWQPVDHPLKAVDETTIYIYDNPSARQAIVGAWLPLGPLPTDDARTRARLWASYFGGGMSSVLFQDIREFRSLAYSASGQLVSPDLRLHPDGLCGFRAAIGSQADKAMTTLTVLDSLIDHMPLRPTGVASARQAIASGINARYPGFREMAAYVAACRLIGHAGDPDRYTAEHVGSLGDADVAAFWRDHVRHRPRAYFIVGPKRTLDLARLSRLGRVVELRRHDIAGK